LGRTRRSNSLLFSGLAASAGATGAGLGLGTVGAIAIMVTPTNQMTPDAMCPGGCNASNMAKNGDSQFSASGGASSAAAGGADPGPDDDDKDRKDPAKHEAYKDELRANMQKPAVRDPELSRMMDAMYRPGAKVGSGSTASAVRQEMQTGASVQGRFHTQKAGEMAGRLEGGLSRNPTASSGDRAAAENTLRDLRNALSGKP
jgi:hypothetical protein